MNVRCKSGRLVVKTVQQCAVFSFAFLQKGGVTVKDKLNARQKKFAEYYAQSGNIVQSAIKAGYSEKYANADACKILENPRVSEYIKELTAKAQQDRIITAVERQAILSDIAKSYGISLIKFKFHFLLYHAHLLHSTYIFVKILKKADC